jgi:cyclopropane-fatty-acyl-phospholipid synthase
VDTFLNRFIQKGRLRIVDSNDKVAEFGSGRLGPQVTIRIRDKSLFFKLMLDFVSELGEAYMDERFTLETGTISDLFELVSMNYAEAPSMFWQPSLESLLRFIRPILNENSLAGSRRNIAHHYDLSSDFYKLFLDRDMQYSCAYFTDYNNDLDTAQSDKKRLIAAKLLLKEGMRVLDIGCGFGGMAIFLAKNYGVKVTGITLSKEQYKIAVERSIEEELTHRVDFQMLDYRKVTGAFDRIVSVGMFEHVGVENYKEFFAQIKRLLTDDGVALLHAIGRMDGPGNTEQWLLKYIFPGGYAPALSEVLPVIEKSGLWATDIELLRLHYAFTLKCWHDNFDRHRNQIRDMYDERFCRMWECFLAASEMYFRHMGRMVFHIQLSRRVDSVPITRNYLFERLQDRNNFELPEKSLITGSRLS